MEFRVGLLVVFVLNLFFSCDQDVTFDSEIWKKAGGESITLDTRLNMKNDLIESRILLNKNEAEIIELLGQPARLHKKKVEGVKYFAVQEIYGWNIDPEEMIFIKVIFNKKRKSSSVELYSFK